MKKLNIPEDKPEDILSAVKATITGKKSKKKAPKMDEGIKLSGTDKISGKSNKLGYGGRAAQLKREGVPGGEIGILARKAHAAPGQANYHAGKK